MSDPHQLWGVGELVALFGDASKVVCPFPRAGTLKHPQPDQVPADLDGPTFLTLIDPRDLWASQGWVLREHAEYYKTGRWELTGRTSADQDTPSNWYPLVVADHLGRKVIRAGHHRATVALIEGRPLLARVFPDTPDQAIAVLPRLLWGWTSRLPNLRCRTAGEAVSAVREGRTALCKDADVASLAAIALCVNIHPRRLPNSGADDVSPPIDRTIAWVGSDNPRDVTGGYGLCTTCGGLRATPCPISGGCEDHCSCEGLAFPDDETGEQRERRLTCQLCRICGLAVAHGHGRWRLTICQSCLPQAREFNRRAGRTVIPPGIHSIVNGGPSLEVQDDTTEEQYASFANGMNQMFAQVSAFDEWGEAMLVDRFRRLGLEPGRVVPLEDYLARCRSAGITADDGWHLLRSHLLGDDADLQN